MGGRLALVVASQCDELPEIRNIAGLARQLLGELCENGGWASVSDGGGPLVNPGHAQLRSAVAEAFATAAARQATLLIGFIGHGVHDDAAGAYYLLARDSPELPMAGTALDLGHEIKEGLNLRGRGKLDGLIVMVDACASGRAITRAGQQWLSVIPRNAARMELLTASADESTAFDACFTRTVVKTLRTGDPAGKSHIFVDTLKTPIAAGCRKQEPGHMSLTMSGAALATRGGDPGLWLVPNWARADAVTGRPSAALIDQLTRDLFLTSEIRRCIQQLVAGPHRLRMAIGPAGSGKSAIMGMLVRATVRRTIPAEFICAAVFLDAASSPESVAEELTTQLSRTLPGFAEAAAATARSLTPDQQRSLGALDRLVTLPLTTMSTDEPFHLIVDGLDQPDIGNREALITAISAMTRNDALPDLCVIAGVRRGTGVEDDPRLAHGRAVMVELPSVRTVIDAVVELRADLPANTFGESIRSDAPMVSGWLIARLLTEVSQPPADWSTSGDSILAQAVRQRIDDAAARSEHSTGSQSEHLDQLLALLAAAGVGPVLPVEIARNALAALGTDLSTPGLRDLVTSLGALVARAAPSTDYERIGLAHWAFAAPIIEHIDTGIETAHLAVADSLSATETARMPAYRAKAGARHLALGGRTTEAVSLLDSLESSRPADNVARWRALLPELLAVIGAHHPDTLLARHRISYWRGESGEVSGALTGFRQLVADQTRVLGKHHRDTLRTRHDIATCRSRTGDVIGALASFERLLADQSRELGEHDRDTLRTRHSVSYYRGECGDITGAYTAAEQLLADLRHLVGPDHPDTLAVRHHLATRLGQSGDVTGACAALESLRADQTRVLGAEHPNVLRTRNNIASWRGGSGDLDSAIADSESLLVDQIRVLGTDHPDVLRTRYNIATWRARSGETAAALDAFEQLLPEQVRALGPDHPATLATRTSIARSRGETSDPADTPITYDQLLPDPERFLRPSHSTADHRSIGDPKAVIDPQ
ncbi:tetratricopeptide repeat protein [Nocardia sp. NPDC058176]|uniref:tetratricopeptide repeat protein n=1 Tax=Nocardia sp. NPDC058176 TaxID=3346368 RepID=UPI0036D787EE